MRTTKRHVSWIFILTSSLLAFAALLSRAPIGAADNGKREDGQGKFAGWTAEWWQWVLELPVPGNPLFDETGENAYNSQPNPKAFYLVGVINESGSATRHITIPSGTPLFGPLINIENDNIFYDPPVSVPQLRADAAALLETALYELTIDGDSRNEFVSRIKSPTFDYILPVEDNIYQFFGVDVAGRIKPAVSDGYWFYIPSLAPGEHTIKIGGQIGADPENPDFIVDITYHVYVTP
jgi:hypothetical protein